MNAFDPEQQTQGRRSIASHDYPLIGPYDSGDPAVIEYHLLLMKLAGIDGVIVDWYGVSDLYDYPLVHRNTQTLFKSAAKLGLRVGICYEDQTITKLVAAKRIMPGERVAQARRDLEWLRANWFTSPAYLKWNDKPVLLSFGEDGLSDKEWEQVLYSLKDAPLYLSEHRRREAADGTFDWPQPQTGMASVESYYRAMKAQALFMPVAFPASMIFTKKLKCRQGIRKFLTRKGEPLRERWSGDWEAACRSYRSQPGMIGAKERTSSRRKSSAIGIWKRSKGCAARANPVFPQRLLTYACRAAYGCCATVPHSLNTRPIWRLSRACWPLATS